MSLDADLYRQLLEGSLEGVALVDAQNPEHPVVYVNPAFEILTGYSAEELLGRNLRMLQGEDRDQDARHRVREALGRAETCRVLLRNYRKDGSVFWNEVSVSPVRDGSGLLKYFAGHHRDAGDRLRTDPKLPKEASQGPQALVAPLIRDDRLTGLYTLPYLEELLRRDWGIAQREGRSIAIFAVDIDSLQLYNSTFGRAAGDSAIRRVAHCVAGCLRRSSDATARAAGGSLIAYAPGLTLDQAFTVGQTMAERVRELRIHHPRSAVLRYMSVSVGVCAELPVTESESKNLLERSAQQLKLAKSAGRNRTAGRTQAA